MMVANANSAMEIARNLSPFGNTVAKAFPVNVVPSMFSTPSAMFEMHLCGSYTPEVSITSAVIVQTTIVSMNTSAIPHIP